MSDEIENTSDDNEPADPRDLYFPYNLFHTPETKKQRRQRLAREAKIAENTKPHEAARVKAAMEAAQRSERYDVLKERVCDEAINAAGRILQGSNATAKQVADFATEVLHHMALNLTDSERLSREKKKKADRIAEKTAKRVEKRAGVS